MNSPVRDILKKIPYFKRAVNYIRDINRYHQMKSEKPFEALIETTNHCNLHCPMCYTPQATRKKGFMDLGTYRRAIEQCFDLGIKNVHLYTVGEPLLHPDIVTMIEIAKQRSRTVYIYTNGILLNGDLANKIINAGLDYMFFSIEGCSKEKYEKIRKGGDFEKLLRNVSTFKRLRDTNGEKPKIGISSTVMDEQKPEIERFSRFWISLVDEIRFGYISNQGGYVRNIKDKCSLAWEDKRPCGSLWNTIVVLWNGDVSMCCVDFDGRLIMGNIFKDNLKNIWQGKDYKNRRWLHVRRQFHKMPMCGACDAGLINIGKDAEALTMTFENMVPRSLTI